MPAVQTHYSARDIEAGVLAAHRTDSGFSTDYFEDVSDAPLRAPETGTSDSVAQATLSLLVYMDNFAQKAENATRSVREGQIRLYRCVFRAI